MFTAPLLGFVFGFVGSVPVAGPIAILVFSRGLQDRGRSALYLAAGSAVAESLYAYLAFWGLSELLEAYSWLETLARGAAALILSGLGAHFVFRREEGSDVRADREPNVGNKRSFVLGLTITALNPTLIATWTAAVTALHSLDVVVFRADHALPFSLGVFAGICSWFALMLVLLARYKERFTRATIDRTVRAMGVLLLLLGLGFAVRFALSFGEFM